MKICYIDASSRASRGHAHRRLLAKRQLDRRKPFPAPSNPSPVWAPFQCGSSPAPQHQRRSSCVSALLNRLKHRHLGGILENDPCSRSPSVLVNEVGASVFRVLGGSRSRRPRCRYRAKGASSHEVARSISICDIVGIWPRARPPRGRGHLLFAHQHRQRHDQHRARRASRPRLGHCDSFTK